MKKLAIIIITYIIVAGTANNTFARSRDLYGVDIVTRQERGADENMAFDDHSEYAKIREKRAISAEKNAQLKISAPAERAKKEESKKRANEKQKIRLDYLNSNFFEKFSTSFIQSGAGNREFRRWRRYNDDKTEIIVHHTVTDKNLIKTIEDEKKELRKIYTFHTFTRERGDIGYNFIIGPSGTIYEGRAGGEGVVGAHSVYNNNPSVGIALIGNFEVDTPSSAQIASLEKLIVGLSYKYKIDVKKKVSYHRESSEHPYVETLYNNSLVGHRDTGRTSCPGENLYKLLPQIITNVSKKLQDLSIVSKINPPTIQKISQSLSRVVYKEEIALIENNKIILPHAEWASNSRQCFVVYNKKIIGNCSFSNNELRYTSKNSLTSGDYQFLTVSNKKYNLATTKIINDGTTDDGINNVATITRTWEEIKKEYANQYSLTAPKEIYEKIVSSITTTKIKELRNSMVKVLLYEASLNLDSYSIECDECMIQSDVFSGTQSKFFIEKKDGAFLLDIMGNKQQTEYITIKTNKYSDTITIKNYTRKSYIGIPRNSFYGTLTFSKEIIPVKGSNDTLYTQTVINTLPLFHYLAGVVESNDTESIEHNKTLSILAKNYMIFYLDPNHKHPSIAKSSTYNAIDDPDLFQKYVGAGLSKTLTKRYDALQTTHNEYLMYSGELAFTPYFSCSPGFTWSAKEKRGRSDTPYLTSQKDIFACDDFKGHGVGMSGRGAAKLAQEGKTYKEILQYYFPGTTITKIE